MSESEIFVPENPDRDRRICMSSCLQSHDVFSDAVGLGGSSPSIPQPFLSPWDPVIPFDQFYFIRTDQGEKGVSVDPDVFGVPPAAFWTAKAKAAPQGSPTTAHS